MATLKTLATVSEATSILAKATGGKPWKGWRVYIGKGFFEVCVGSEGKSQVQWNLKSYDKTPEIRAAVDAFNDRYEVVKELSLTDKESQRNGLIARFGVGEVIDAENDIARENWDI